MEVFLEVLGITNSYKDIIDAPEECEIAVRTKNGRKYLFVLNYIKKSVTVILKQSLKNLYEEIEEKGEIEIEPYGTRVYTWRQ